MSLTLSELTFTIKPAVAEALESHVCRCTGYVRYFEAVRDLILATPSPTRHA